MKGCEEEGCRGGGIPTPLMSPKTHAWTPCDDRGGCCEHPHSPGREEEEGEEGSEA